MKLEFLTFNNRPGRTAYLRVFDEDNRIYDIEMSSDKIAFLLSRICNTIWSDYLLVPRD